MDHNQTIPMTSDVATTRLAGVKGVAATELAGVNGVWNPYFKNSTVNNNRYHAKVKLPCIGIADTVMASSSRALPTKEQSSLSAVGLSPRPGRRLRLSVEHVDRRCRSVSPHSPRHSRPITKNGQDVAGTRMHELPCTSPPRDTFKKHHHFLQDSKPSVNKPNLREKSPSPRLPSSNVISSPVLATKNLSPRLAKKHQLDNQTFMSQSQLSTNPKDHSARQCRTPTLSRIKQSSSADSEEGKDSPREPSPLPPINSVNISERDDVHGYTRTEDDDSDGNVNHVDVNEKKQLTVEPYISSVAKKHRPRSRSPSRVVVKSRSLDSEPDRCFVIIPNKRTFAEQPQQKLRQTTPNWLLEDQPSLGIVNQTFADGDYSDGGEIFNIFSDRLPDRIPLPHTSAIFQQALNDMTNSPPRPPSRDSDPGDLHVRRSSLVTGFLDLATLRESVESMAKAKSDSQLDIIPQVPEEDTNKEMQLKTSTLTKISDWAKRSRKISAPATSLSVGQRPITRSVSPKRHTVSEVQPPRMEFLEPRKDKPKSTKISDSMSDSALTSPSLQKNEALNCSKSEVIEISRPLLSKRAMGYVMRFIESAASLAVANQAAAQSSRLLSRERTVFPMMSNSSGYRSRDRRDSLRMVQQVINEGIRSGDTTEITSFDDLKNCRYLRTCNFHTRDEMQQNVGTCTMKKTPCHEW